MARHDSSARRYAEAAFQLAVRDDEVDGWRADLATAATALAEPRVARVLADQGLALEARQHLVQAVLGATLRTPVRNMALLLLQRGRLDALPAVLAEFIRLDNARQGIVTATAISAAPLEPAEVRHLTARLEQLSGGRIELSQRVDPSLLGGLQVQLGDRLIDGSVRGRLERLRHRLASGAL
ncbi:MAG TPA: ATP synthase F1 subunit delta [Candidatus Sulfotelmatobacter sp.]|nr:ATP synthase F1 subunit delta [Candidatus Sulfotelmatobacter sp.]